MMKKSGWKYMAVILAAAMVLTAGCGRKMGETPSETAAESTTAASAEKESEPPQEELPKESTLRVSAGDGLSGIFSPFYAESGADCFIVDAVSLYTLTLDRAGNPLSRSIEGESSSYEGKDYAYTGAGDVTVSAQEDGTFLYDLKIRDDLKFSDGEPVTIDDVIFTMYVLLDPAYDGELPLSEVPIQGLEEYSQSMLPLYQLLIWAGEDNTDFTYWTEEIQRDFWENGLVRAEMAFIQAIVDYCVNNGYARPEEPLETVAGRCGYLLEEGASAEDFWEAIFTAYDGDYKRVSDYAFSGHSLWQYLDAGYLAGLPLAETVTSISGIRRVDDYSLQIVTTRMNDADLCRMRFPIAPLHYYGDTELYDYEQQMYGFPKGDLSSIREKTDVPLGAGPYVFSSYAENVVCLDANPEYYKGRPEIDHLQYIAMRENDRAEAIAEGTLDAAAFSYSSQLAAWISRENGKAAAEWTADGPEMAVRLTDHQGYGYVGINANLVKVGDDAFSDASKALRKALATVIAAYRDEAVEEYYGDAAGVLEYPGVRTSWAAPQAGDSGYREAYSVNAAGEPIYTEGMTAEEKCAAALEAALGYFAEAGYSVSGGKVTKAPSGAKMSYECAVAGGGTGDHPGCKLIQKAGEALAQIGFELTVKDYPKASDMSYSYQTGAAELWCAAWQTEEDPALYQRYGSRGRSNYYGIADQELDTWILLGQQAVDRKERKACYEKALERILDWAVEIPVYQRKDVFLFSAERVDTGSLPEDMTPYWDWMSEIEHVRMRESEAEQ